MIVSRAKAEKLLHKKLKGPKKSCYVLSEDGRKNLGGPYSLQNAKRRLAQIEYFKRFAANPGVEPGTRVAFMPTAFEMYYFKAHGIDPGDQGTVMAENPRSSEDPEFDTPVKWDNGVVCRVSSQALRLANPQSNPAPIDFDRIKRIKQAIQARARKTLVPMVRPKYEKIEAYSVPAGMEKYLPIPARRPSGTSLVAKPSRMILGREPVERAMTDEPPEVQQKFKEAVKKYMESTEFEHFGKLEKPGITENPSHPSFLQRVGEGVLVSGLSAMGLKAAGVLSNPQTPLNDETVARALVEHHVHDIEEGAARGLAEYARHSYEDLVGLFRRMTPHIYLTMSNEFNTRLKGLRDLIIGLKT